MYMLVDHPPLWPVGPEGTLSSPFVRRFRRRLRRRRRTHLFGYYTNMVQQIEFIIHTNIQPLRTIFFHSRSSSYVKCQRLRSKISPFFYLKLPMSMKNTWLDFQFFFRISLKPGVYRFSGSASLFSLSVFVCDRKWGYGGHPDFLI